MLDVTICLRIIACFYNTVTMTRALRLRLDFYIKYFFSRAILFILINSKAKAGLHPHHRHHRPDLPSVKMGCYYYYYRSRRRE